MTRSPLMFEANLDEIFQKIAASDKTGAISFDLVNRVFDMSHTAEAVFFDTDNKSCADFVEGRLNATEIFELRKVTDAFSVQLDIQFESMENKGPSNNKDALNRFVSKKQIRFQDDISQLKSSVESLSKTMLTFFQKDTTSDRNHRVYFNLIRKIEGVGVLLSEHEPGSIKWTLEELKQDRQRFRVAAKCIGIYRLLGKIRKDAEKLACGHSTAAEACFCLGRALLDISHTRLPEQTLGPQTVDQDEFLELIKLAKKHVHALADLPLPDSHDRIGFSEHRKEIKRRLALPTKPPEYGYLGLIVDTLQGLVVRKGYSNSIQVSDSNMLMLLTLVAKAKNENEIAAYLDIYNKWKPIDKCTQGALRTAVSKLNRDLSDIGLGLKNKKAMGYRLVEQPA